MSKVEILLSEAQSLTNAERRKLAELLLAQAVLEAGADDAAAGLRGVRAWTESTAGEDWSAFYPDSLHTLGPSGR